MSHDTENYKKCPSCELLIPESLTHYGRTDCFVALKKYAQEMGDSLEAMRIGEYKSEIADLREELRGARFYRDEYRKILEQQQNILAGIVGANAKLLGKPLVLPRGVQVIYGVDIANEIPMDIIRRGPIVVEEGSTSTRTVYGDEQGDRRITGPSYVLDAPQHMDEDGT